MWTKNIKNPQMCMGSLVFFTAINYYKFILFSKLN